MSQEISLVIPIASCLTVILLITLIWLRFRPLNLDCRSPLFSPEYRSFLGQLDIAVRSHLTVFPRMSVNDVLEINGASTRLGQTGKLRFDFVLCHRREMEVMCVVQLGDSPETAKLKKLCDAAGLTLLEYDIKPYRDVPSLRKEVFGACGIDEFELPDNSLPPAETPEATPECPKCGASMKRHTLKKGKHAGEECWICERYPNCKGARLNGQPGAQ